MEVSVNMQCITIQLCELTFAKWLHVLEVVICQILVGHGLISGDAAEHTAGG